MKNVHSTYLALLILSAGVVLSAAAFVNYTIDPASLFHTGAEARMAEILLSGKNIANYGNGDERLLQKNIIERRAVPPKVVVLGSSRAMRITKNYFPGSPFFNHSVAGASLEDIVAIDEMLHQKGERPSVIVLMLDAYFLNAFNTRTNWKSVRLEYFAGARRLGIDPHLQTDEGSGESNKLLQLISLVYLKESVAKWRAGQEKSQFFATDQELADSAVKLADGSRNYPANARNASAEDVHQSAIADAKANPVYGLNNFARLHPNAQRALEALIKSWREKNILVFIYLPPYHPAMHQTLRDMGRYALIEEAETYYKKLAAANGVPVLGGFDPAPNSCGPGEFYDGSHASDPCVAKILSQMILPKK